MKSSPERAMRRCDIGRVFDIRRFCVHDGDGIRTGVFLKGCPLKCAWCHNPEGIPFERRPIWFDGRCMRCGTCASMARNGGVVMANGGVVLDIEACEDWNALIDACPTTALRWDSRDMTADEVVGEVMRDGAFIRRGGVTLTGGEPLAQPAFALELLKRFKKKGVHTAIETSLYAAWEDIEAPLEYLDLVYCDLKIWSDGEHRRHTGVSNGLIKENMARLLKTPSRVVVRTPLIPPYTSTTENISRIAGFIASQRPDVEYELLNYNPLAPAKYPLAGKRFALDDAKPLTTGEIESLRDAARAGGVRKLIT